MQKISFVVYLTNTCIRLELFLQIILVAIIMITVYSGVDVVSIRHASVKKQQPLLCYEY